MRAIRASVVSVAALVDSTVSDPSPLIVPANTPSPGAFGTGTLSPVMGDWSTPPAPSTTVPSRGTRSPGRTRKRPPTGTRSGATTSSRPSGCSSRASGGVRAISAATARRARPTLQASRVSDRAKKKATVAASSHWPIATAPTTATTMSRFMSGRSRLSAAHAFGSTVQTPARMLRR